MGATDVLYVRLPAETMAEIRRQAKELGLPISTFVDILLCETLGIPDRRAGARQELARKILDGFGRP